MRWFGLYSFRNSGLFPVDWHDQFVLIQQMASAVAPWAASSNWSQLHTSCSLDHGLSLHISHTISTQSHSLTDYLTALQVISIILLIKNQSCQIIVIEDYKSQARPTIWLWKLKHMQVRQTKLDIALLKEIKSSNQILFYCSPKSWPESWPTLSAAHRNN